jgi:hemolysin III
MAISGTVMKLFFRELPRSVYTALYVGMGWLAVVAVVPLVRAFPVAGLAWMLAGGLAYTAGAVVYAVRRPDPFPRVFGFHEIFHVMVLAGSVAHFVFLLRYVAPVL